MTRQEFQAAFEKWGDTRAKRSGSLPDTQDIADWCYTLLQAEQSGLREALVHARCLLTDSQWELVLHHIGMQAYIDKYNPSEAIALVKAAIQVSPVSVEDGAAIHAPVQAQDSPGSEDDGWMEGPEFKAFEAKYEGAIRVRTTALRSEIERLRELLRDCRATIALPNLCAADQFPIVKRIDHALQVSTPPPSSLGIEKQYGQVEPLLLQAFEEDAEARNSAEAKGVTPEASSLNAEGPQ